MATSLEPFAKHVEPCACSLCAEVGVDNDKAEKIWDEYVKG